MLKDKKFIDDLSFIASSWDLELISSVARELSLNKKAEEIITPDIGIKTSVYGKGLSEDPYLCGAIGDAIGKGIQEAGAIPVFSDCSISQIDADYMDKNINPSVINNYIVRPFEYALKDLKNATILNSSQQLKGNYAESNDLIKQVLTDKSRFDCNIICDYSDKMKKITDFMDTQNGSENKDSVLYRALSNSVVLLKNKKILPLKQGIRLAVVGEGALRLSKDIEKMQSIPFEIEFSEGYRAGGERDESLLDEAYHLAKKSDAVLLLIKNETNLTLSANILALIDSLKKADKPIISVIYQQLDTSFDCDCDALILCPKEIDASILMDILSSGVNPSAKLTSTLYENTDHYFSEIKKSRDLDRTKVGAFFGYRYCDVVNINVKYPFGHGLTYSKFSYSKLKVDAHGISFRIKNISKIAGFEVAQVYIGIRDSNIIRPIKELKCFEKVYLAPNETKTIRFDFNSIDLSFYDENGEQRVEAGKYIAYVGSSVFDIRLKKEFKVIGELLSPSNERLSDYISSKSNILSGGYKLQREGRAEKEILLANQPELEQLFIDEFEIKEEDRVEEVEIYDNSLTPSSLADGLFEYLIESGLPTGIECVRSILCTLASSKTIIIIHIDEEYTKTFISALYSYFDSSFKEAYSIIALNSLEGITDELAKNASLIKLSTIKTKEKKPSETKKLKYRQFLQLVSSSEKKYEISESIWKRVDKLEKCLNSISSEFCIYNKLWRSLEKYTSFYLAIEDNAEYAINSAINSIMILKIMHIIKSDPFENIERLKGCISEENIAFLIKEIGYPKGGE